MYDVMIWYIYCEMITAVKLISTFITPIRCGGSVYVCSEDI